MFISSRIADSFEASFFSLESSKKICPESYIFLLVQRGGIRADTDSESCALTKGDIYLLQPSRTVSLEYLSANQVFEFKCKKNFIESHIPPGKEIVCNSAAGRKEDYHELLQTLEQIAQLYAAAPGRENAFISALYRLLDLLANQFSEYPQNTAVTEKNEDTADLRVQKIRQYIEQHYHLPVFLQTLADEMYLSPQYLSKFIRQSMGITFNKYLNNVRLEHALEELINTKHSITEIAFNNGFSNASAFNKQFRDMYQVSPSAYRKEHREAEKSSKNEPASLPAEFIPVSNPGCRNIDISFETAVPYHPSWKDTINIGVLSNALGAPFHDALMTAQRNIRFRYVRFYNMFSDDVLPYIAEKDLFKFTNLDMIFDFFCEANLIPFIDLCYKYPKQSLTSQFWSSPSEEVLFADELPLEKSLKALRAVLQHFIGRYGRTAVSKWRFEVWSKHDEQLKSLETPAEYWDKFCAYHDLIKELLPDCAVGGPGFNTARPVSEFRDLMAEMTRRQLRPDFFSIYIFCYTPDEYVIRTEEGSSSLKMLAPDPDYPLKMFDRYRKEVSEAADSSTPLYVTEFNSGINGYNHLSGSCFQAAFICKNMLDLFQKTDCVAYWTFADIPGTLNTDPQIYATGMGLIEQHGLPKPGFFSYVLLSKLKTKLADVGKQYIAATNGRSSFQFLIFNYVHYNLNFCCTYQNRLDIGNTYDVFEETEKETCRVRLTHLPKGRYKCMIYILNRSYGSILDKFIHILHYGKISASELNYMLNNMQPEEIIYYQKEAKPRMEILYRNCTDGSMEFQVEMDPHEVRLVHLERKT